MRGTFPYSGKVPQHKEFFYQPSSAKYLIVRTIWLV